MRQEVEFVKCSPTQNMTILVTTSHPRELYPEIAARLMAYDSVYAEQVGFVEEPMMPGTAVRLQMAGGEFCGNACLSLAALIASGGGLRAGFKAVSRADNWISEWANGAASEGDLTNLTLETSGAMHPVPCQVRRTPDSFLCQAAMPIPRSIERQSIYYEGSQLELAIVRYEECLHIVMEEKLTHESRQRAESLARLLGVMLGTKLVGILLYNPDDHELAPLIYVPALDSMVWERGCGSGTASLGAYLAWTRREPVLEQVKQPGGMMTVMAHYHEGEVTDLRIEGNVHIVARGKAYVEVATHYAIGVNL